MTPHEASWGDLRKEIPSDSPLWTVDLASQRIFRTLAHDGMDSAPVSTSRFGTGNEPNSNRTPLGWHQVKEIIGSDGSVDQEYISREPVPDSDRDDRILSRILWLDGLEPGLNQNSFSRYIYIHGTNHTDRLGTAASLGCVRMDPETIADWVTDLEGQKPVVWIGNLSS